MIVFVKKPLSYYVHKLFIALKNKTELVTRPDSAQQESDIPEPALTLSASDNTSDEEYLPPTDKKKSEGASSKQKSTKGAKNTPGQVGAAAHWKGSRNYHVLTQNSAWVARLVH